MTILRRLTTTSLLLPILLLSTIPIAILAILTTTLAFTLLFLRVLVIYIDLFLAIIPHYLSLLLPSRNPKQASRTRRCSSSLQRRTRRRGSSASATGTITPISPALGLSQSVGPARDFEGVGGWRLGNEDDWSSISSCLELPAEQGRRHHRRSATSGSQEMNTRRVRTPPAKEVGGDNGYFGSGMAKGHKRGSSATGSSGSSKNGSVLAMKMR